MNNSKDITELCNAMKGEIGEHLRFSEDGDYVFLDMIKMILCNNIAKMI